MLSDRCMRSITSALAVEETRKVFPEPLGMALPHLDMDLISVGLSHPVSGPLLNPSWSLLRFEAKRWRWLSPPASLQDSQSSLCELSFLPTRLRTAGTWQSVPRQLYLILALSPQVRAIRLSFVGELGWELHVPRASCLPVYRAVMAAGAKHGLVNAGYRAIDSLSIEKGESGSI